MNKKVENKKPRFSRIRNLRAQSVDYAKEQMDNVVVAAIENQNKILLLLAVFGVGVIVGVVGARRKGD